MISMILEGKKTDKIKSHLKKYGPYYGVAGLVAAGLFVGRGAKKPTILRTAAVDEDLLAIRKEAEKTKKRMNQSLNDHKKDLDKMKARRKQNNKKTKVFTPPPSKPTIASQETTNTKVETDIPKPGDKKVPTIFPGSSNKKVMGD